jgi:hypothetical protein
VTTLTRRRDPHRPGCWRIYYGDVLVGAISERTGGRRDEANWDWNCGFYPGTEPGEQKTGSAATFEIARAQFQAAWLVRLSRRTETDFQAWRDDQAFTAWKYAMWDAGAKLPTQTTSGTSHCFCGAPITIASTDSHIREAHRDMRAE